MFTSLPWYLASALIIIFTAALAILCTLMVRKLIPAQELKKNHEIAGYFLGIVGVLYSVLLGFTVINAQNRYNDLHETVHTEAALIADLYRDAGVFPEQLKLPLRENLKEYTRSVIENEWAVEGLGIDCVITREYSQRVWNTYYDYSPANEKEVVWYKESISKLDKLNSTRLMRLFSVKEDLGSISWTLLYLGAILTVALMLFFAHDNVKAQLLMTSSIAGYLAFILFLIYSLDNAFTSQIAIQPLALQELLVLFEGWK
jgi:hypothetical protein